jgi:RNA polymerase sigma-70 factor (ECF subfamily)
VGRLDAPDRNVLRAYYAAEMTVDEIAAAFGIHRATAARRVRRARDHLVAATRRGLADKLQLHQTELESVMRLIESRLHLSVGRLLA